MRRSTVFIVLVLLLGLVSACVEAADDDSDDSGGDSTAAQESPTSEPTEEEPTAEPDPTATPEPDPTPEETATPTSEPEVTATSESDDGAGEGEEHVIDIQDNFFDPEEIEISSGDTVTWVNNGGLVHTSTLDPEIARDPENAVLPDGAETWDSGDMEPGDEFSVTLDVPGEYVYFCRPHEALGMVGTIIVTDDGNGDVGGDDENDDADEGDENDEDDDSDYP